MSISLNERGQLFTLIPLKLKHCNTVIIHSTSAIYYFYLFKRKLIRPQRLSPRFSSANVGRGYLPTPLWITEYSAYVSYSPSVVDICCCSRQPWTASVRQLVIERKALLWSCHSFKHLEIAPLNRWHTWSRKMWEFYSGIQIWNSEMWCTAFWMFISKLVSHLWCIRHSMLQNLLVLSVKTQTFQNSACLLASSWTIKTNLFFFFKEHSCNMVSSLTIGWRKIQYHGSSLCVF